MTKLFAIVILASISSPILSQPTFDTGVLFVSNFYKEYLRLASDGKKDVLKREKALIARSCTNKLIASLSGEDVEADPFLNAQDVDPYWLSTLSVVPQGTAPLHYRVSFSSRGQTDFTSIKVKLVRNGSVLRIDGLEAE